MEISNIKNKLISQNNLTSDESFLLFNAIMNGEVNEIDTSAILIALKTLFKKIFIILLSGKWF